MKIAIDGPAGAGKSTVAQHVAKKLGFIYIDTGAMYRALTLAALEQDIEFENEDELVELLHSISIRLKQEPSGQRVFIGDREVTAEIRHPEINRHVSTVAKHPKVRREMVRLQRNMAEAQDVVMDGRDIGTHVLPDAEVKIFLTASMEERAMRRYNELVLKGHQPDLEDLKQDISRRDRMDSERASSPLRCAEDATVIDSTGLSIDQVVDKIIQVYQAANRM